MLTSLLSPGAAWAVWSWQSMHSRLFWLMCRACGMRILPGTPMRPLSGWHLMQFSLAGRGWVSWDGFMFR